MMVAPLYINDFCPRFHGRGRPLTPTLSPRAGRGRRTLIEILDVRLPRLRFHRGEARSAIPYMDLELVAVRIEKIERGTLALVVFPHRCPRGSYPLRGVIELGLAHAESNVRIFGQRGRPRPLVQGETEPQIAVAHGKRDVIDPGDHIVDGAVWRSKARINVATAPSTAALIPR